MHKSMTIIGILKIGVDEYTVVNAEIDLIYRLATTLMPEDTLDCQGMTCDDNLRVMFGW